MKAEKELEVGARSVQEGRGGGQAWQEEQPEQMCGKCKSEPFHLVPSHGARQPWRPALGTHAVFFPPPNERSENWHGRMAVTYPRSHNGPGPGVESKTVA